jgi:carboxyl-terminal processing protease
MQQQPRLPLWFLVANWALIAGAFFLGARLGRDTQDPTRLVRELPMAGMQALAVVHHEILTSHVDPQDAQALLESAIKRMVGALDPYSRYVPAEEVARYEEDNTGHYDGIGADFDVHAGEVVLHFPLAGGPAERAGLEPGDVLLAVDGNVLDTDAKRTGIVQLVRGPSGSEVELRLRRGDEQRVVRVTRGDVQRPCVKWVHRPAGGELGYLHLTDFHPGAAKQIATAIESLEASGPLRGLLLDLRWNGGGSLDECVAIARAFLPSGLIVSQTRRGSDVVERHEANPADCRWPALPLVLLVNDRSASASEVLAGALQDHGRAAIVGERTHGKGYVNTVYTWKDLPFRLKLTTGRYRTPNGRDIERHHNAQQPENADAGGIAPDVAVAASAEQRTRIAATLRAGEAPDAWRAAFVAVARRYGVEVAEPPRADDDPQLDRALTTLRERAAVGTDGSKRSEHAQQPGKDR